MQIIFVIVCLAILVAIFYKVVTRYDAKRQRMLEMVLNQQMRGESLKTHNKVHTYSIIYRDRYGDLSSMRIEATNELEAQFNFVTETLVSYFKIQSVKRL